MSETVLIKIPKELKKQLKHQSVQEERTMSEIVCQLIDEYINNK
jgi:predicted DNA-binding protein